MQPTCIYSFCTNPVQKSNPNPPTNHLRPNRPLKINTLNIPPPPQSPPKHPILTINLLFTPLQLRNEFTPLQPTQQNIILRPRKINHTIPRTLPLLTRRRHHTVNIRPQQPIRELDHRITQIHNRVARQRTHIYPLPILPRR